MSDHDDDKVRDRAYALWQAAGSPDGQDQDFWHQAERELTEETDEDTPEASPRITRPTLVAGTSAQ